MTGWGCAGFHKSTQPHATTDLLVMNAQRLSLSPRVRGNPDMQSLRVNGAIPACAGKKIRFSILGLDRFYILFYNNIHSNTYAQKQNISKKEMYPMAHNNILVESVIRISTENGSHVHTILLVPAQAEYRKEICVQWCIISYETILSEFPQRTALMSIQFCLYQHKQSIERRFVSNGV